MPFTFSHPAIVLPFLKDKKMSATALIVGSMSPDLEYFFRMSLNGNMGHTFPGIFLIDFPLGFAVIFVFHLLIKRPLIDNLPAFFQRRLQPLKESDWISYFKENIIVVLLSFFLGTLSHILWDSITHHDGYFVQRIAFLNDFIFDYPVYRIIQHISTIVGLTAIYFYIDRQPITQQRVEIINLNYWYSLFSLSMVIFAVRFSYDLSFIEIVADIVSAIYSLILAVTTISFFFRDKKFI